MWRVYIAGQIYSLIPPYGSNLGHKIADIVFLPVISFIIAFTALECIMMYWDTLFGVYIAVQIYPLTPLMGKTGVVKVFAFLPFITFVIAFTALECIKRYLETICEELIKLVRLPLDPSLWVKLG